jgi:hypothetical protein
MNEEIFSPVTLPDRANDGEGPVRPFKTQSFSMRDVDELICTN